MSEEQDHDAYPDKKLCLGESYDARKRHNLELWKLQTILLQKTFPACE